MDKEIQNFDPSKLMQGVKDRIKATFVSLVPDDKWDEMVKTEIDAFFLEETKLEVSEKSEEKGDFWQRKKYLVTETQQTPFRAIVWGHCTDMTYQILKEKITKEYFSDNWACSQPEITKEMAKVVSTAAPKAMENFFQTLLHANMGLIQSQIQSMQ